MGDTKTVNYTSRLESKELARWKVLFNVQAPYRWNLRRLKLGYTLDVGCGIGRNLIHLGGNGVGVDHNQTSVSVARARGLQAFTAKEFHNLNYAQKSFDSLLIAHVLEHMTYKEGFRLVKDYLPYVRTDGSIVFITPQEAGYRSDSTHVEFIRFAELESMCNDLDLSIVKSFSFPFPRFTGSFFKYNEFIVVAKKLV
ncbi:class I SAM-dependent methyltransferase [Pseudobacteriovorax antillogorgiicola]|uniref:2-polyprenyl-3-methyl-5-hydroxy-6-metoxy-1,4-benzoquinol methylase n=1 Tax=Pseudobacteriovorax antillogorgiicola TaxID=1513793 RepID=A0A1Y6CUM3_9BACT|nr:methyltransferase domain-containing protein [Pseudobacteriovorax antillogorgiicola]TCS45167.1 2-polyprenyl-3-methyl-5-hydroxy-6-metoxy-1,4-benzoquinol methylase [Pseudobacteriovorax antillogorgiicola]SMF75832.1 2-polyprenyl-3-methyl-5-hydroxy-6-metoxy-1,4-benzoquinol methylase [Pseudobacteriovorax antillogorgiicola]